MQTAEAVGKTPNLEEVMKADRQSMSGPAPCDWHLQLALAV